MTKCIDCALYDKESNHCIELDDDVRSISTCNPDEEHDEICEAFERNIELTLVQVSSGNWGFSQFPQYYIALVDESEKEAYYVLHQDSNMAVAVGQSLEIAAFELAEHIRCFHGEEQATEIKHSHLRFVK